MIRIAGCSIYPFVVIHKEGNGKRVTGSLAPSFHFLMKYLNKSYEILESSTNEIGTEISPGNWTGIIGMIQREEADISMGQAAFTVQHFPYVGISTVYETTKYSVMSGPPVQVSTMKASFLSAVSTEFWLALWFVWFLISTIYYFTRKMEVGVQGITATKETFIGCLLTFYGLMFQRGFDNLPATLACRLIVTGWLILVIVIMVELGGVLTSSMAVADVPVWIDSPAEILKYPDFRVFTPKGLMLDAVLSNTEDPIWKKIWSQIIRSDGLHHIPEFFKGWILDEVSSGQAVVLENDDAILLAMVNLYCQQHKKQFYISKEGFYSIAWAYMYRRSLDPKIIESVNMAAMTYGGGGFHQLHWKPQNKYAPPCLDSSLFSVKTFPAMVLRDTFALLDVFWIGLLISFIVLCFEIVFALSTKNRSRRANK